MEYLILIYLSLFALLSRLNMKLSVLLLVFALPSYLIRFSFLGIPTTLLESSLIITFISWIFDNKDIFFKRKPKKEKNKKQYPFRWEILLVLIIAFISVFVGGLSNSALGIFKTYFLGPILLFILVFNTTKESREIKDVILALTLSSLIVSIVAVWQKITGQLIFNEFWADPENRRVVSVFGYPNAVALFIAPILPLMLGSFFSNLKEKISIKLFLNQLILSLSFILGILAIYFAKSKGALLAIGVSVLIGAFILLRKKIKIILLSFLLITIPLSLYLCQDWIRLQTSSSLSYQIRKAQWEETAKMLKEEGFFWGAGLSNYQEKIEPYHQEGIFFNIDKDPDFERKIVIFDDKYRQERWQPVEIYLYPHNIFLNFWVELGFLGMILFSFIIFKFIFLSLKAYQKEKNNRKKYLALALGSSMIIILSHGIFDVPYFKNDLAALFWLLIALLAIFKTKNKPIKLWKK
jgi:O-antigen ligase